MTILIGLTLSCLVLNVYSQNFQPQSAYYPQYHNPDSIYFPDTSNVVPLARGNSNVEVNKDVIRQIFGTQPAKKTAVEIEKSNEISTSTTVEQLTGRNSGGGSIRNSGVGVPSPLNTPSNGQIPQTQVWPPLAQPDVSSAAKFNRLLYSVTNVGLTLLKNINVPGNVVLSPYSIASLLSLLQQGSSGLTLEELTTALHMTASASAASYSQISADYKNRNSRTICKTASNVFVGESFIFNRQFKKIAQANFDSDVTPVNFAAPERATQQINNWVASRTNDKVQSLIPPGALDISTQLALVNAIYFKGLWEVPFRAEMTVSRPFRLVNGQQKTTSFMRMRRMIRAGVDPATKTKVVLLPFERNEYSLMVILPSPLQGIAGTLANLTDARLLSYLSFTPVDTELELPKFTVRGDTDLQPALRSMGITRLFSPYAEITGLGTYQSQNPEISSAVHSAVLSIDEQGGTAAAATAFAAVALSYDEPTLVFRADSPFIVVLWDTATSLPLFMAKIENPEQ